MRAVPISVAESLRNRQAAACHADCTPPRKVNGEETKRRQQGEYDTETGGEGNGTSETPPRHSLHEELV